MEKRVIPLKNYLIFAMVAITSFGVVYNVAGWYKNVREEMNNTSIMPSVISEILSDELNNYLVDNASPVIYMASSKDKEIKTFEKEFKKLIINNEIADQIIYLDTSKIFDQTFYTKLITKYFSKQLIDNKVTLDTIPNIMIFKDREVVSVLYKTNQSINKNTVELFLVVNEVIE